MPQKLAVHKFCAQHTNHARGIGATNTLIFRYDETGRRYFVGDNTDWSGLHKIISAKTKSWPKGPRSGFVIGARGGSRAALYALYQLRLTEIIIVNRTKATADKVARDFSSIFHIRVIPKLQDLDTRPDIMTGTIPADKTAEADFTALFENASEYGLCIDMSYKPRRTPLLTVAESRSNWKIVAGVEVLLYQAFDQFELWTGLKAPQEDMMEVVAMSDRQEV
jgi:shikimate 5-dehydrogenase